MKVLSRDFSTREKILMLILCLLLLGIAYYRFVSLPVREAIANAEDQCELLSLELTAAQQRVAALERMRAELEELTASSTLSAMGSYNNSKAELALLNDILSDTLQYTIAFSSVTREGDQIRRNFALQFTADSYDAMQTAVERLSRSEYRCLISDMSCTASDTNRNIVTVNATATFYETMVGGVIDEGLPADSSSGA